MNVAALVITILICLILGVLFFVEIRGIYKALKKRKHRKEQSTEEDNTNKEN